jgi:ComF family protein
VTKEAVFSSSEDRIRASQASAAVVGHSIVSREASSGPRRTWSNATLVGTESAIATSADRSWLKRLAESLFSVLFPSDCRICGEPQLNLSRLPVCPDCLAGIHPVGGKVCDICGERILSSFADRDSDGLRRCPVCRRVDRPFSRAVAYGSYAGGLRELVHLLKYNGVRPAANVLGRMLAEALTALQPDLEQARFEQGMFERASILVIPVPLYKTKRRERGFNQAELVARAALKIVPARERLEFAPDLLQRTRDTQSQIGLTSHQRRENLRGAFAVTRAAEVTGRAVILVDDVYTTGTTATECARVLRRAGARQVWVATVARTMKLASVKLASNYAEIGQDQDQNGDTADTPANQHGLAKVVGS